jgi:hypothetical protein
LKTKKETEDTALMKEQLEMAYKKAAQEDYECYKEWEDTLTDGL